jgi:hypothetical protein
MIMRMFFNEMIEKISEKSLEICLILCDNMGIRANDLKMFLKGSSNDSQIIIHIPCINHINNLIFKNILNFGSFGIVNRSIPDLLDWLNSPIDTGILG